MWRRWTLVVLLALAVRARAAQGQESSPVPVVLPAPQGTVQLAADLLEVDLEGSTIFASGNVVVSMPPVLLSCAGLLMDVEGSRMQIDQGTISIMLPRGLVSGSAGSVSLGEGRVVLGQGVFSLCGCQPPPWSLAFTELTVEDDGDVTVKRGALRIGGLSVLPLPWLLLRTGRRPALLAPTVGWIAGRGLHLALGFYLPAPLGMDLSTRVGWIAPTGLTLETTLSAPGQRLSASMVLDPVDEGIDAGWLHGRMWGEGQGQRVGLVLDLPLSAQLMRADMPGPDGAARRQALSSLVAHLVPSTGPVLLTTWVAMVRSLQSGSASMLETGQTWITAPAATLCLTPIDITAGRFPLTAAARLGYMMLFDVSGSGPGSRIDSSAAGLVLANHLAPGRVLAVDTTLSWHGALIRGSGVAETNLATQKLGGMIAASMALAGPVSSSGFGHRIDLDLSYRATLDTRWGSAPISAPGWLPAIAPLHLAGAGITNTILHHRETALVLGARGWIIGRRSGAEPLLGLDALLDLGPAILELTMDLSGKRMTPSLISTRMTAVAGKLTLLARHLYLVADRPTSLDIELWSSASQMIGPVPGRDAALHLAMLGLTVPIASGLTFGCEGAMDLGARTVSYVLATVSFTHPCQCLRVGVSVLARAGVPAPDVLITFSL